MKGRFQCLCLFVAGGDGVCKTFLIRILVEQVNRCYGFAAVEAGVVTGVSARLVRASHSLLKLPVQKDHCILPVIPCNCLK